MNVSRGLARCVRSTAAAMPARPAVSAPARGFFGAKHFCTPKAAETVAAASPARPLGPVGVTASMNVGTRDWSMVYEGHLWKPIRQLKMLSSGSLVLGLVSAPVIVTFPTETMDAMGKYLLAGMTVGMAAGSTILTHLIASPYVCRVFVSAALPNIAEIHTPSFFGPLAATRVDVTDPALTTENLRPLTSFAWAGKPKKSFFVHEDIVTHPVFAPILPTLFAEEPAEEAAAAAAATAAAAPAAATPAPAAAAAEAPAAKPTAEAKPEEPKAASN